MVSFGIMAQTTQVNVRLPERVLSKASKYAKQHGFSNVQDLIKETLREKLFGKHLTKEELKLVKNLTKATEENNLWGTEEELFKKLRR